MTAFADIQSILLATLTAIPALASGRVYTNPSRALQDGLTPAIVLRLDAAEATEFPLGTHAWRTAFIVECYARATAGQDPVAAVDPLLVDTWERLAALDNATLGADLSISPKIDWQYDATDTAMACAVIRLTAQHYTATTSLLPQA